MKAFDGKGEVKKSITEIGYKKLKSMGRVKILHLVGCDDYEMQLNETLKSLDAFYLVDIKEISKDTLMIIYKDFEK